MNQMNQTIDEFKYYEKIFRDNDNNFRDIINRLKIESNMLLNKTSFDEL